jgi:riboflavin biosynthesis pyrimidine reductase
LSDVAVRRLHPDPARVTVQEAADSLDLRARAPADRPYLIANMAVTADGRATLGRRSGPIGGEADRALFHALRGQVDAVLAGTGTLRAERYGRLVRDPGAREARVRRGLGADPLAVTVTRSGRLPLDIPLFEDEHSTVVVCAAGPIDVAGTAAAVRVQPLPAADDLGAAMRALRAEHEIATVLCEGGPTLLSALLVDRLVDELFLTIAPRLAGTEVELPALAGPPLPDPVELDLLWALESEGELMLRYRVAGGP